MNTNKNLQPDLYMADSSLNPHEPKINEMEDQRIPPDPKAPPPAKGRRRCGRCQMDYPATEPRCPNCDCD